MRNIDEYTKNYLKHGFEDRLVTYRRRKVIEIINKYHPYKILEIGCGMEPLFNYMDYEFAQFTVFEPSIEFYNNALNLADLHPLKNKIVLYNAPYYSKGTKNNYDMIICSGLLHELEDATNMISEIYKDCGKDTIVHFNVPNARSLHRLCAFHAGIIKNIDDLSERNVVLQQHSVFTKESLRDILICYNFDIIEGGSYFIKPFTHDQMEMMITNGIISENILDGLYKMSDELPEYGCEIYFNCKMKLE